MAAGYIRNSEVNFFRRPETSLVSFANAKATTQHTLCDPYIEAICVRRRFWLGVCLGCFPMSELSAHLETFKGHFSGLLSEICGEYFPGSPELRNHYVSQHEDIFGEFKFFSILNGVTERGTISWVLSPYLIRILNLLKIPKHSINRECSLIDGQVTSLIYAQNGRELKPRDCEINFSCRDS